jgi:methyl-accepting chemotaxis protein
MPALSDLRLIWKVIAAPAFAVIVMTVVAALLVRGTLEAERAQQNIEQMFVIPVQQAKKIKDQVTLAHAHMLAVLLLGANDTAAADRAAADAAAVVETLSRILADIDAGDWQARLPAERAKSSRAALAAYVESARSVAETVRFDLSYAVLLLGEAIDRFELARGELDRAADTLQAERQRMTRETHQRLVRDLRNNAVIGALAALTALALAIAAARLISRPLVAITAAMGRLAAGDRAVDVPGADRRDEVGAMAAALRVFRDNLAHADRLAAEQACERAAKERRQAAMDRHTQDFGMSVASVMSSLAAAAETMRSCARTMAEAASGVREQAGGTAVSAEKSSSQLAMAASAIEEMTSSVAEISRQVAAASQVAREAVGRAGASQRTLKGLDEATSRIGDVVRLIRDIAGRTNLLALNATIEAARAGEAGRGFSVVAGEVKALATQTGSATQEIGGQIEAVRSATEGAIAAMADVATIIGRLDEVTAVIAAAVEEQSATTREMAANLQAVAEAGGQTTAAMKLVVSVSDEAGAVSGQVQEAAGSVGQEAERLRAEVDHFLGAVRDETGDRRRYERIPGNAAPAQLRAPDHAAMSVVILDLSRGGMAAACSTKLPAGTEVTVDLPGAGGAVSGRVVRSDGRLLAAEFCQDAETQARLDRALEAVGGMRQAA